MTLIQAYIAIFVLGVIAGQLHAISGLLGRILAELEKRP